MKQNQMYLIEGIFSKQVFPIGNSKSNQYRKCLGYILSLGFFAIISFNTSCSDRCFQIKDEYNRAYHQLDLTYKQDSLLNADKVKIPKQLSSFLKLYDLRFSNQKEFESVFSKQERDLNSSFYWTLKGLSEKDTLLMRSDFEKAITLDKCELNRYARFELYSILKHKSQTQATQLLAEILRNSPSYPNALEEDFFERISANTIDEEYLLTLKKLGSNGYISGYNLLGKYYELSENFTLAKLNYELALSQEQNAKSYIGLGNINKKTLPDFSIHLYNQAERVDKYSGETANFLISEIYEGPGEKFNIDSAIYYLQASLVYKGELYNKVLAKLLVLLIHSKKYEDATTKLSLYIQNQGKSRDYLFFEILIAKKSGNNGTYHKYLAEYKQKYSSSEDNDWLRNELSAWDINLE